MKKHNNHTQRMPRMAAILREQLGEIIQENLKEHFDTIPALVTVSSVEPSSDFRWAKVWLSIIGSQTPAAQDKSEIKKIDDIIFNHLEKQLYYLQGELNRRVDMRQAPRIQLFLDTTPRYAQHINELLTDIEQNSDDAETTARTE